MLLSIPVLKCLPPDPLLKRTHNNYKLSRIQLVPPMYQVFHDNVMYHRVDHPAYCRDPSLYVQETVGISLKTPMSYLSSNTSPL